MLSHYLLLPKIFVYLFKTKEPNLKVENKKKKRKALAPPPDPPAWRDDGEGPRPPRERCPRGAAGRAGAASSSEGTPYRGALVTARRRSLLPGAHPQTGRGGTGRRPQPRVCAARRVRRFPGITAARRGRAERL